MKILTCIFSVGNFDLWFTVPLSMRKGVRGEAKIYYLHKELHTLNSQFAKKPKNPV